tara:strand:- start:234 stop:539 length:306 start_codon:yes stop_codon:yes gene_type:complete
MAKNNYRTTFTGVTTAANDTTTISGTLVGTVGTPYELNVVERSHASGVAAPVYTGSGGTQIAESEALTIMNVSGRFLKQHLAGNYTTTKVKKIILTIEMGA